MSTQVQKSRQFEFPNSKFPIDIADTACRDAKCARERFLARRFRLDPTIAALIAELAFSTRRTAF
jgi:hypothetical protein